MVMVLRWNSAVAQTSGSRDGGDGDEDEDEDGEMDGRMVQGKSMG